VLTILCLVAGYVICLSAGRAITHWLARSYWGTKVLWATPTVVFGTILFLLFVLKWISTWKWS